MKLKKLELTAVEFFERVINGEKLYATANPKHAYYCVDTRGCIGNTIDPLVRINPSEKLNKPRTVWIEQKWYEDIPEQGVLCWTNDRKEDICLIVGYHEGSSTCRFSANIISYKLPIPLTPEEIKAFLPAEPVTKYDESNWAENPSIEFPVTCHVSRNPFSDSRKCPITYITEFIPSTQRPFKDDLGKYWEYAIPVDE